MHKGQAAWFNPAGRTMECKRCRPAGHGLTLMRVFAEEPAGVGDVTQFKGEL